MKRFALIAIGIATFGILLPILNPFINISGLRDLGFVLFGIGFFSAFVFLTVWQSEISRKRLIITSTAFAFVFIMLLIYSNVKATEALGNALVAKKIKSESSKELSKLTEELSRTKAEIDSLKNQLENCDSTSPK